MLKRLSQAEEVAEKANTGKNACTTKSSFLCAPRRFLVPEHAGWKAGGREESLPHKKTNTGMPVPHEQSMSAAQNQFAAKPRCATRFVTC